MGQFRLTARYLMALLVAVLLVPASVFADDGAKRKLVEQKLKLVEMMVRSPAAKGAPYGREAESTKLIDEGQKLLDQARQALAADQLEEATKVLDAALKAASAASVASRRQGASSFAESAQRKQIEDQREQVLTYRAAVVDMTKNPALATEARQVLVKIDALSADAKQHEDAGRLGEANKRLAEAYRISVEELSRLRAGQEVVMSLKFDTPADEFAYEQKRFASTEIMVEMMINEGRAEGGRRGLVDKFSGDGKALKIDAERAASGGDYAAAVGLMEKATGQLNRALQSMGVPVF
jgi:hypothetical protein